MAEAKTKATKESVTAFLNRVDDKTRREDCFTVLEMMRDVTKEEPKMWGSSIVGFGRYRYKYESGREGEWPVACFSPRKGALTVYLVPGFDIAHDLMKRLGKYKTGKSCLYIKSLADVDRKVLRQLIDKSVKKMSAQRIKD
jgi:hypothetical protein